MNDDQNAVEQWIIAGVTESLTQWNSRANRISLFETLQLSKHYGRGFRSAIESVEHSISTRCSKNKQDLAGKVHSLIN